MENEQQVVPIVDFGSQYTRLIARKVREAGVFSSVIPAKAENIPVAAAHIKGIILSGSPASAMTTGDACHSTR